MFSISDLGNFDIYCIYSLNYQTTSLKVSGSCVVDTITVTITCSHRSTCSNLSNSFCPYLIPTQGWRGGVARARSVRYPLVWVPGTGYWPQIPADIEDLAGGGIGIFYPPNNQFYSYSLLKFWYIEAFDVREQLIADLKTPNELSVFLSESVWGI